MNPAMIQAIIRGLPVLTLPVAVVLGFIGYQIESSLSSRRTPVSETSISEEREKRLLLSGTGASDETRPTSVFDYNLASELYKKKNF